MSNVLARTTGSLICVWKNDRGTDERLTSNWEFLPPEKNQDKKEGTL